MRERITYIHNPEDDYEPKNIQVQQDSLGIKALKAAKEDRLTAGVHEVPQEIWLALKQCHELRIRWVSRTPYATKSPFVSRLSPGLHVFFTPQRDKPSNLICPLLQKVFGKELNCLSPEESFIKLPVLSERFATSASFQYYQSLLGLEDLITYISQKICPSLGEQCHRKASSLRGANYVDLDFDTISQALDVRAFYSRPTDGISASESWTEQITRPNKDSRVEVGILATEKSTEPESLTFGGFLTVIGEDAKPSPTQFSFPSRHHPLPASSNSTYSTIFLAPIGLHPTMRLTIPSLPSTLQPPAETCSLHTYLTLPSTLFPDKYQMSSPLSLASKNLRSIRAVYGETDLEAPVYATKKWGSAMLIELAPPLPSPRSSAKQDSGIWHADIPLHLRYLPPINITSSSSSEDKQGISPAEVPWPVVFWACTAEEGTKMNVNPFDRVSLGYDGLFGPRTMFYHFKPRIPPMIKVVGEMDMEMGLGRGGELVERIDVPVLMIGEGREWWIEMGTVLVVVAGFLWITWKVVGSVMLGDKKTADRNGEKKSQ